MSSSEYDSDLEIEKKTIKVQLLQKMTELNGKLDTATSAIGQLTKKVYECLDTKRSDAKQAQSAENKTNDTAVTKQPPNQTTTVQLLTRKLGYVNWQRAHNKRLGKQRLVKVSDIRAAVALLCNDPTQNENSPFSQGKSALSSMRGIAVPSPTVRSNSGYNSGYNNLGYSQPAPTTTTVNVKTVDKETRFPLDAVYVDTNLPHVKTEIDFLRQVNVRPTNGVIERFMSIIEKEMHTTATFEEKHELIWH